MPQQGDVYVLLIIIVVALILIWIRFKKWLYSPSRLKLPFPVNTVVLVYQCFALHRHLTRLDGDRLLISSDARADHVG